MVQVLNERCCEAVDAIGAVTELQIDQAAVEAVRSSEQKPRLRAVLLGGAALALLFSGPVRAQTAAPVELETIEVQGQGGPPRSAYQTATGPVTGFTARASATATKTGTPLIETPASVSVVGQTQIQATGAQTVPEALNYSPGVRPNSFGFDPRNDWFLIRGFTAQDTGYFLDGLQLFSTAFATFKVEPYGLERLDVLAGPSSTLYGGSGSGGLIDAISEKPLFVPYHRVEAGVDNYGNAYGAFDLSGPLGDKGGPFFYRLTGLGRAGGTQVDFTDYDRGYIAPAITYRPDGLTTFTVLGQYQRDFTNGENFLPYQGTVRPAPYGRIPTSLFTSDPSIDKFEREQAFAGYQFEHVFDNLTVRQNFRYSFLDIQDRTVYGLGYAQDPTATQALLARGNFITTPRAREVAVDNQAETHFGTWGAAHTLLLGLDYKHYELNDNQGFALAPSFNLLTRNYNIVTTAPDTRYTLSTDTQDQLGFYAQDQIKIGRLSLLFSGREDLVGTSVDNRLYPSLSTENNPTRFTGRVAAIYNTEYGIAPYVGYSTSFNPVLGTNSATQQPLRPESGEQEEVGVKYQAPNAPIFASLALFNLTRSNVLTTDPNNALIVQQTGEERSRGIELSTTATLMEGLKAVGTFTAYDITNTRDLNTAILGKVPVAVPEEISSLFLDYTVPTGVLKGFGFGAGERYVGRSYADQLNQYKVPDYWLTDAALHYERDGWRAAVNATNLLDKTYVGSCSSVSACFYGDRRRITASLSFTW